MDNKEFKKIFNSIAEKYKFIPAYNAWFKESEECIMVLIIEKSNNGNYYNFRISIFIKNLYNNKYTICKDLTKKPGNIRTGEPKKYTIYFDLEENIDAKEREKGLDLLFSEYIAPLTELALSRIGIKQLAQEERIILFPAVKEDLERLCQKE